MYEPQVIFVRKCLEHGVPVKRDEAPVSTAQRLIDKLEKDVAELQYRNMQALNAKQTYERRLYVRRNFER